MIELNQTRITNAVNYAQIGHILSHFSSNYHYQNTFGFTSAYADDICDPDTYDEENSGFKMRQKFFCFNENDAPPTDTIIPLYVYNYLIKNIHLFDFNLGKSIT